MEKKIEASLSYFFLFSHIYFHCVLKISIFFFYLCAYVIVNVASPPLKIAPIKIDTGAVQLRASSKGIHPGLLDLGIENSLWFCAFHS